MTNLFYGPKTKLRYLLNANKGFDAVLLCECMRTKKIRTEIVFFLFCRKKERKRSENVPKLLFVQTSDTRFCISIYGCRALHSRDAVQFEWRSWREKKNIVKVWADLSLFTFSLPLPLPLYWKWKYQSGSGMVCMARHDETSNVSFLYL